MINIKTNKIQYSDGHYIKICTKCNKEYKSETDIGLANFFPYRNKADKKLEYRCKECKKIHNEKYSKDPKVKSRKAENYKNWASKNVDKVKGYSSLNKELLDSYKALSNLNMLSKEELMFFKEKLESKLKEINTELENR